MVDTVYITTYSMAAASPIDDVFASLEGAKRSLRKRANHLLEKDGRAKEKLAISFTFDISLNLWSVFTALEEGSNEAKLFAHIHVKQVRFE